MRAGLEGFSTFSIGLMGGAYFLGFTLGCLRGVALVHLLLGLYIIFRITRRTPVPDEEQIPFVDALASTQTASIVYEEEF